MTVPTAKGALGRAAREPLTHFLLIGALIFVSATTLKDLRKPVLKVDEAELRQLTEYWTLQMQRPPTREEMRGLVRERLDEEILAREAVRRGLDKDDIIIRRRLAQKMAFADEDTAPIPEPDDATLRAAYDRTADRYQVPSHMALRQVFFSAERGDTQARAAAAAALAGLKAGGGEPTGDPLVMPRVYADVAAPDLVRDYGEAFAGFVAAAPTGVWSGPVKSAYGWHLVRVESRAAPTRPPFEAVRPQVRDAWLQDRRRAANAALMDRLRARYRIEIAGGPG